MFERGHFSLPEITFRRAVSEDYPVIESIFMAAYNIPKSVAYRNVRGLYLPDSALIEEGMEPESFLSFTNNIAVGFMITEPEEVVDQTKIIGINEFATNPSSRSRLLVIRMLEHLFSLCSEEYSYAFIAEARGKTTLRSLQLPGMQKLLARKNYESVIIEDDRLDLSTDPHKTVCIKPRNSTIDSYLRQRTDFI